MIVGFLCFLLLVGFWYEVVSLVRYIHGGNIPCCCFLLLYVYQAILLDAGMWVYSDIIWADYWFGLIWLFWWYYGWVFHCDSPVRRRRVLFVLARHTSIRLSFWYHVTLRFVLFKYFFFLGYNVPVVKRVYACTTCECRSRGVWYRLDDILGIGLLIHIWYFMSIVLPWLLCGFACCGNNDDAWWDV